MQAVILLGAPGSGKGTAADGLTEATGYIHFSTGNSLREALAAGTPLGLEAKSYIDAGDLVPDETVMKLVTERLVQGSKDARYIFDGFPRTLEQARLLDDVFAELGASLTHVFLLDSPTDVLVDRIANRLICRECGAVYHRRNIPPKVEGVCDDCGGELYQRPDDNETTVRNRLDVYEKQTASLVQYYEDKGLLVRINAEGAKEATNAEILPLLQKSDAST